MLVMEPSLDNPQLYPTICLPRSTKQFQTMLFSLPAGQCGTVPLFKKVGYYWVFLKVGTMRLSLVVFWLAFTRLCISKSRHQQHLHRFHRQEIVYVHDTSGSSCTFYATLQLFSRSYRIPGYLMNCSTRNSRTTRKQASGSLKFEAIDIYWHSTSLTAG